MASNTHRDADERQPRSLIHEAQEKCFTWQHLCMGTHQRFERQVDPGQAVRGFHAAVINYWSILHAYRTEKSVSDMWEDEDLLELAPYEVGDMTVKTLADLGKLRFATGVEMETERDPVEGTKKNPRPVPVCMDADHSAEVLDALNDVARELGLGITIRPTVEDDPLPI